MSQGIGRQTPGDLRGHNRQRPSHGAFSEAAVLFLRDHPAAQQYLARLEKKHAKGTAFTILAQQLARAVSSRLTRQVAFDTETFFQREGRGAEEPEASLDNQGNAPQRGAQYGCMPCVRARQSASSHDALSPSL